MKDRHELARCVFCELQFQNRLAYSEFNSWDEMCIQLLMDDLGHGINGKPKPWSPRKKD